MSERDHPIPEIISFIRKSDGRGLCFGRWPSAILETYLRWHHQNGSLVIVEQEGDLVASRLLARLGLAVVRRDARAMLTAYAGPRFGAPS